MGNPENGAKFLSATNRKIGVVGMGFAALKHIIKSRSDISLTKSAKNARFFGHNAELRFGGLVSGLCQGASVEFFLLAAQPVATGKL
jgi:hypothetical protein